MEGEDYKVSEYNGDITLVECNALDDWFIIEKAHHEHEMWMENTGYGMRLMHSGRISDADIEGDSAQMLGIAKAILDGASYSAKRCAVDCSGDKAEFYSPRNSQIIGSVPREKALSLANQIVGRFIQG